MNDCPAEGLTTGLGEMTDQQAREFVEALAVPQRTSPPQCPICGHSHPLEAKCVLTHGDGALVVAGSRK
jgi:hypothetical protein